MNSRSKSNKKTPNALRRNRGLILVVVVSFLALGALVLLTREPDDAPSWRKDAVLTFLDAEDRRTLTQIEVEIADDFSSRMQGLMHRKKMRRDRGMLFIFPGETPQSFWMKNTFIPLDIVYVNSRAEIVSIAANTVPLDPVPIPSKAPAQYVVEVNAGFCSEHGIQAGDLIRVDR